MAFAYLIALGSNRPHARHGPPHRVLAAALARLAAQGIGVRAVSPLIRTRPLGPALRAYANGAAVVETALPPPDLLARLKQVERGFGRRRDLDIVLWDAGCWAGPALIIPHPAFRERAFVLGPAAAIAGGWRDPLSGFTVRQLHARLTRHRPLPIRPSRHPRR